MAHGKLLSIALVVTACGGGRTGVVPTAGPADLGAATAHGAAVDPSSVLPIDPRVKVGTLPNGLTYYILPNARPEQRAQLWLAVDAGSVLEDDDQQGLAHFVEHMAFNGTARFPKQAIIDFLERIGMDFGADLNAYTSFDETVYQLTVPTDDPALLGKGLDILRDWAGGLAFDPVEVDKERGVVTEEWRLGRGADGRIGDKQYPVLLHGSRYGDRLPIGKPEILMHAPREALVRFYQDWYRPDLMAVIAVGTFDAATMEQAIRDRFADLAGPASPRPRGEVAVPAHAETLVSVETDPEMPTTSVTISDKFIHQPERTANDYRRYVVEQLYHAMFGARLDELRQRPDAPFVWAWSSDGSMARAADALDRGAMAKEGEVERALTALLDEVARVERHGFGAAELARAKQAVLRGYQQGALERPKRDSRDLTEEIVRNFLEHEFMPGAEAELALVEGFLPGITLADCNGLVARLSAGSAGTSRVILISGPASMKKPSQADVLALVRAVDGKALAAWDDGVATPPLMATAPSPGTVTTERSIAEIGVTEWTLANGVRVVLKPTDFKNDEIQLQAFSPGGTSVMSDAVFDHGRFADAIVAESGAGPLDATQLRKALAGKVAWARGFVGELEEGVYGHASAADLDTLLQLVHLQMTAPRRDERAFAAWRAQELEASRNRRLSPETSFFEDMGTFLAQNHRRRQPVTPQLIGKVDLDQALAAYRERFADAGDFTFVLVGNLDLAVVRPLVETYLGSLPSTGREETWKDVGVRRPKGRHDKAVIQGSEPKSYVYLTFHGDQRWSKDADNDMQMLSEVLDIRLREVLREDLGGVYGASTWGEVSRRPRQERSFGVFFGCAPDNVEKLRKAVFDEVAALQKQGIGESYIAKVKESRLRRHQTDVKENGWWAGELDDAYRYGEDPRALDDVVAMTTKISSARIQAAARRYLASGQYVLGVLRPAAHP